MRIESAGQSHIGRRPQNEDAFCVLQEHGMFVVADGLGGQEGGEVASRCVVDAFAEFTERVASGVEVEWPQPPDPQWSREENLLAACTTMAHRAVQARRVGYLREMGSTVVALALSEAGGASVHVGDSRLYRLREGQLEALTRDHSMTEELRAAGLEPPPRGQSAFGHIITRALGTERAEPSLQQVELRAGDVYLLCSDGLYEPLAPEEIAAALALPEAARACEALVTAAYDAGGRDNITAVVVRILER